MKTRTRTLAALAATTTAVLALSGPALAQGGGNLHKAKYMELALQRSVNQAMAANAIPGRIVRTTCSTLGATPPYYWFCALHASDCEIIPRNVEVSADGHSWYTPPNDQQ